MNFAIGRSSAISGGILRVAAVLAAGILWLGCQTALARNLSENRLKREGQSVSIPNNPQTGTVSSGSQIGSENAVAPVAPQTISVGTGSESAAGPAAPTDQHEALVKCGALREHDQIWLISTRGLGCPGAATAPSLPVWLYNGNGGWIDSSVDAFLAADNPAVPTVIYVHGNFETADDSVQRGLVVYSRLAAQTPADRPMRFVIWSWPTDRGKHPLQLTRIHAHRADVDAYYLGWLVNRIDHRVQVGLLGYSLGTRVVTGALHLLGGGELCGLALQIDAKAPHQMVRAALLAAAEDCDWIVPGHPNGQAIPFVDRMLLLNNSCDRVLKMYPHLERCDHSDALGYVGICGPYDSSKVEQIDVCCAIGPEHEWSRYFYNDRLVADMLPYLFLVTAK
jgi:hypothetical protein